MEQTLIKICGITRAEDALAAVEAGAHALGFIFYAPSSRYVDPETVADIVARLPPFVTTVGVFVNADVNEIQKIVKTAGINLLQLHGEESPELCNSYGYPYIKGVRVNTMAEVEAALARFTDARGLLLDTLVEDQYGGTGRSFPWERVGADIARRLVLAGGLHEGNVAQAIQIVRPYAVDVSTGVERCKGVKDHAKIKRFVAAVRAAGPDRRLDWESPDTR